MLCQCVNGLPRAMVAVIYNLAIKLSQLFTIYLFLHSLFAKLPHRQDRLNPPYERFRSYLPNVSHIMPKVKYPISI
jgi:hypothetical protein